MKQVEAIVLARSNCLLYSANTTTTILANRESNLSEIKEKGFAKIADQYGYQVPKEHYKHYLFVIKDQQISNAFEEMDFKTLLRNNIVKLDDIDLENASKPIEFKLQSQDFDQEALMIQNTVVKKEQENSEYAGLVRIFDENGKLQNGIATIFKQVDGWSLFIQIHVNY